MIDGIRSWFSPPPVPPPPAPPPPAAPPEASVAPAPAAPAAVQVSDTPNASSADVRKIADSIFLSAANQQEQGQVSQTAVDCHDTKADLDATKQVHANEKLEHDALAKLPAAQQAEYKKLAHDVEDNPQAHMALQLLLLEGKLTGDPKSLKPDGKGQTLLDGLVKVDHGPIEGGAKAQKELLGNLLRETAQPSVIKQGNRDSCTVTSLQIMTARSNPAEYVRIVGGLAAPAIGAHGKPDPMGRMPAVELANGKKLERAFGANDADDSGRTLSSRLWQGSMMNFAAQETDPKHSKTYDVQSNNFGDDHGTIKNADGSDLTALNDAEMKTATEAVTGKQYGLANRGGAQDDMLNEVKAAAGRNQEIKVELGNGLFNKQGEEGTQSVTVTGVAADGTVSYKGADGKTATMSAVDFHDHLHATPTNSLKVYDQKMLDALQGSLKANPAGVPVGLKWGDFKPNGETGPMGHEVLVTKIEGGRVYYTNPHGDLESMGQQEFMNRIGAMSFQRN